MKDLVLNIVLISTVAYPVISLLFGGIVWGRHWRLEDIVLGALFWPLVLIVKFGQWLGRLTY